MLWRRESTAWALAGLRGVKFDVTKSTVMDIVITTQEPRSSHTWSRGSWSYTFDDVDHSGSRQQHTEHLCST